VAKHWRNKFLPLAEELMPGITEQVTGRTMGADEREG
jgi:hypothetical protein